MKILDSFWFSQMAGPIIGIVKIETDRNEIKYYIGNGAGEDKEKDEISIAQYGAKFPEEAFNKLI